MAASGHMVALWRYIIAALSVMLSLRVRLGPHPAVASGPPPGNGTAAGCPNSRKHAPPGARMGRQANAGITQTRPGGATREQAAPGFFAPGPPLPGSLHAVAADSRYASAELDPRPAAAARARRLTCQTFTRWDMASLTQDAEIIATEIVANAINAVPPGTTGLAIV